MNPAGFLRELVGQGAVSAAVGSIGDADRVRWSGAAGLARPRPPAPATTATRFDLASLTKPMVGTLALALDRAGLLALRMPLAEIWPRIAPALARQTLESLLRHRSGLQAWAPLYARCRSRRAVLELLLGGSVAGARRGTYGDLGYILWGFAAETVTGQSLWSLLDRHVARPLRLRGLALSGSPAARLPASDLAAPATDNRKEIELAEALGFEIARQPPPAAGRAQDGNARFLGGVAAHAGLYGTARDLWRLGSEWLRPGRVLDRGQVAFALSGSGEYALGWARRRIRGSAGPALSRASFGHTGFAGGSLWIDPERDRILILLSHRSSALSNFNAWRRRWHAVAMAQFP